MLRRIARRGIPVLAALLGLLAAFVAPAAMATATYDVTQVGDVGFSQVWNATGNKEVKSGDTIWLGSTLCIPDAFMDKLADRVDALLADEAARFTTILDSLAVDADATDRLEGAAAGLRDGARAAFDDLTAPELD